MEINFGDLSDLDNIVFIDNELLIMLSEIQDYSLDEEIIPFINEYFLDNEYKAHCLVYDLVLLADMRKRYIDLYLKLLNYFFNQQINAKHVYSILKDTEEKWRKSNKDTCLLLHYYFNKEMKPFYEENPVNFAIFHDKIDDLKELIRNNESASSQIDTNSLALAAKSGSEKCFFFILDFLRNQNKTVQLSEPFCEYAVEGGNIEILRECIKMGFSIKNILTSSVRFHRYQIFDAFVDNPNVNDCDAYSAAENSNLNAFIKYVLERGSDPNAKSRINDPMCAIIVALQKNAFTIVKMIIELIGGRVCNKVDRNVPLCWSGGWRDIYTTKLLLAYGDDPNVTTAQGRHAMHSCVPKGYTDIGEVIYQYGGEIDHKNKKDAITPLIEASAKNDNYKAIYFLLSKGADPNALTLSHKTALHNCAANHDFKSCAILLYFGARTNIRDNQGDTPISIIEKNEVKTSYDIEKLMQTKKVLGIYGNSTYMDVIKQYQLIP